MNLLKCRLCEKIFTSAGGRTCPACLDRLDVLYPKVREFLRDHPKIEFNVNTLADELNVDIRDVQALVEMGYLDRETGGHMIAADPEESDRQKLAKEFENSLKQMKEQSSKTGPVSYGQQRYGEKYRRKDDR